MKRTSSRLRKASLRALESKEQESSEEEVKVVQNPRKVGCSLEKEGRWRKHWVD